MLPVNYMTSNFKENKIIALSSQELTATQDAAGRDALKALGPISEAEANYYRNLK